MDIGFSKRQRGEVSGALVCLFRGGAELELLQARVFLVARNPASNFVSLRV